MPDFSFLVPLSLGSLSLRDDKGSYLAGEAALKLGTFLWWLSWGWMCECVLGWTLGSVGNKPGTRIWVCTPCFGSVPLVRSLSPSSLSHSTLWWYPE